MSAELKELLESIRRDLAKLSERKSDGGSNRTRLERLRLVSAECWGGR